MTPPEQKRFVRLALLLYAGLLAAAWLWRSWLLGEPLLFASPEDAAVGTAPARDLALGLAVAAAAVALSAWLERRAEWARRLDAELRGILGGLSPVACLVLALASGVGEEAFFRGALQPRVGLVAASLLFGLAHFPARPSLRPWTAMAVCAGFVLGWLFERTGNLLAPTAAHVAINAVALLDLRRAPRRPPDAASV